MLTPIEQRVLGVLIEKELTVPDSYPLTESALLSGCNQKSNRDPEMALDSHEIHEALSSLRESGWVTRVDATARAARYRHNAETMLGVDLTEKSILCELLVRGPQAPGALKPRIARMNARAEPPEILATLERLASRPGTALVEQEPRRPRERDSRWIQLLGPSAETDTAADQSAPVADVAATTSTSTATSTAQPDRASPAEPEASPEIMQRIEQLERQVLALNEQVFKLMPLLDHPGD